MTKEEYQNSIKELEERKCEIEQKYLSSNTEFKIGDILVSGRYTIIYRGVDSNNNIIYDPYIVDGLFLCKEKYGVLININTCRLANDVEKRIFSKILGKNGYVFNEETKMVEIIIDKNDLGSIVPQISKMQENIDYYEQVIMAISILIKTGEQSAVILKDSSLNPVIKNISNELMKKYGK